MAAARSPATTTPLPTPPAVLDLRAETTAAPELCGFRDHTSSIVCSPGYTCKFNTDIYAVGCCSNDDCDWGTTCCDSRHTKKGGQPDCGGPVGELAGTCGGSAHPYCGTNRWENGFTNNFCTDATTDLVQHMYFVSAGESTTRAGLLRLTGSGGPGTPSTQQASTMTMRVTETATATAGNGTPSPGVIAGSVIGGAALGILLTVLAGMLLWRKKTAGLKAAPQYNAGFEAVSQGPSHTYRESAQSPYQAPYQSPYQPGGWDAGGGQYELQANKGRGHEIQELGSS